MSNHYPSDVIGNIDLWDIVEQKMLREMPGHAGMRVPVMDWNNYLLAAGAKDGSILIHDVRVPQHLVHELQGHSQVIPTRLIKAQNKNILFLNITSGSLWPRLGPRI